MKLQTCDYLTEQVCITLIRFVYNIVITRVAVVTGANKGLGFETSRQLASNGITVILTARNEKNGTQAVEKLKASGLSDVVFHPLDVKDPASIDSLVKFVEINYKRLDILVSIELYRHNGFVLHLVS